MTNPKQKLVRSQWIWIFIVALIDMCMLFVALLATDNFHHWLYWGSFFILTCLLLLLIWGLKKAKEIQKQLERSDLSIKEIQKIKNRPSYDERQVQFVLKSYQIGFWLMIFILWLGSLVKGWGGGIITADFFLYLALFGGLTANVSYSNLKGASAFVDDRFGKNWRWFGLLAFVFGLGAIGVVIFNLFTVRESWKAFFDKSGDGFLFIVGLALIFMGGSSLYYRLRHKE
ncbi:hypothetical protein N1496_07850 [Streptococcus didelphis]|uniref:ABC transporter permease n=1 Tax=Streptococcus didelphis TaxID=102886 RepID=A0ABY9LGB7_9STRE|nr:hypothetical protein [Streptococcus didelphis]WMB27923.1 hypothetical protein N1496_07850 [Streptococcus didelphis]